MNELHKAFLEFVYTEESKQFIPEELTEEMFEKEMRDADKEELYLTFKAGYLASYN